MVYMILGQGFEEIEALAPCDMLRRGGVDVKLAGIGGLQITGGRGITVQADLMVEDMELSAMEMIVLHGGMGGVHSILDSETALDAVRYAFDHDRYVAAICAAPTILAKLGVTDGKKTTCYPGMEDKMGAAIPQDCSVVRDGKILTGRAAGSALDFGAMLLECLKGEAVRDQVCGGMVVCDY